MKAATLEKKLYEEQAERVKLRKPVSSAFQRLFNTSQLGIGAEKVGMGSRQQREQLEFNNALISYYGAAISKPNKPKKLLSRKIHDNASGLYFAKQNVRAAHVLPFKLGPDLMQAFFGEGSDDEFMAPQNGLLLHLTVEKGYG